MKKHIKKIFSLFALLLFVGAGCGSTPIQPEPGQEEQIFKQPAEENILTKAYEACTKAGHKIIVQYDAKSAGSKTSGTITKPSSLNWRTCSGESFSGRSISRKYV